MDWVFPPVCGGCDRVGARWCGECQKRIVRIQGELCALCGMPHAEPGLCAACELVPPAFRALRTWAVLQDPVQEALHKLKYRRDLGLGDSLAAELSGFVRSLDWDVDAIVPIPLGRKRRNERGYNQVTLIAYPLSLALGLQFSPRALRRHGETRSQVGLSRQARRENVRGAFIAVERLARDKNLLLIDDVATTGSTLSAAAAALMAAGARRVYALTVARAVPRQGRDPKESR